MIPLDTTPDADEVQKRLLRAKTPSERVQMVASMMRLAREIARARSRDAGVFEEGLDDAVFLRLHRRDLGDEVCRRFLDARLAWRARMVRELGSDAE